MTINKSQGQIFDNLGIYLPQPAYITWTLHSQDHVVLQIYIIKFAKLPLKDFPIPVT